MKLRSDTVELLVLFLYHATTDSKCFNCGFEAEAVGECLSHSYADYE